MLTKQQTKDLIVQLVVERQGCRATELCAEKDLVLGELDLSDLIEELVAEGQLVEIECVLPQMSYRIKSFLFPKGTQIEVKNGSNSKGDG